jgi:uncharacterized coiled-coil protein SlyX
MGMQRQGNNVFSQPMVAPAQPIQYQPYQSSYQNPYTRLQMLEQQQAMAQGGSQSSVPPMAWVNGTTGAAAYILPPNSRILLMDSDDSKFYVKETDANGQPVVFRHFRFTEEFPGQAVNSDTNTIAEDTVNTMQKTITTIQKEVDNCKNRIEELSEQFSSCETPKVDRVKQNKKEGASNGQSS